MTKIIMSEFSNGEEIPESLEDCFRKIQEIMPDCDRESFHLGAVSALCVLSRTFLPAEKRSPALDSIRLLRLCECIMDLYAETQEYFQHTYFAPDGAWEQ
jgi:hypothetical protein